MYGKGIGKPTSVITNMSVREEKVDTKKCLSELHFISRLLCCENIHVHDKRTKVKYEISISGVWLMFEGSGELKTTEGIGACWA